MLETPQLQQLLEEERRLRQRLREIETLLASKPGDETKAELAEPPEKRFIKILEMRDKELTRYASELEDKNRQLQLMISSLRLYQLLLESDPAAILGASRDLKLILYNRAALDVMGESLRDAIGKNLSEINFVGLDPYIPVLAQDSIRSGRPVIREIRRGKVKVQTRVYPLGTVSEIRGVLIRIFLGEGESPVSGV